MIIMCHVVKDATIVLKEKLRSFVRYDAASTTNGHRKMINDEDAEGGGGLFCMMIRPRFVFV